MAPPKRPPSVEPPYAEVPQTSLEGRGLALVIDFRRPLQRFRDTRANIFGADVASKFRLGHELRGLFPRAAEQKRTAGLVKLIGKIFYGAEARGIDGRHIAQAEDDDGRQRVQRIDDLRKFIGGSEEKWPVDAKNGRVLRNVLALQDVDAAIFDVIARDSCNRGSA